MNYQPFLDMNILLSDTFLLFINQNKFALLFFLFAVLVAFSMLVILVNDLLRLFFRKPVRNYPPHEVISNV